jgi:hypothetical protein
LHNAEHRLEREPLGIGQSVDRAGEWEQQLVHAGVAEGHLGLDTRHTEDAKVRRRVYGPTQQ